MSVRTVCKTIGMTVGFAAATAIVGYWFTSHDFTHAWSHAFMMFTVSMLLSPVLIFPLVRKTHRLMEAQLELTKVANTDALTGLPNRRSFYSAAEKLLEAEPAAIAAIVLDIDRFKDLNDTYGHAAGDEVLKAVARRIADCLSSYRGDSIAFGRVGGEEFACILSGDVAALAAQVSSALAQAIRSSPVRHDGRHHAVTVSVGHHYQLGRPSLDEIIRRADTALYAAKAAGRDRSASTDDVREWHESAAPLPTAPPESKAPLDFVGPPLHNSTKDPILVTSYSF